MKKTIKKQAKNAQKIDPKMWACGEWLEILLNENLRLNHFRKLADSAILILNIDFKIDDEEPVFHHIRLIDEKTPENENIFKNWAEIIYATPLVEMHEAFGGIIDIGNSLDTRFLTPVVSVELLGLPQEIEFLKYFFQELKKQENQWEYALPEFVKKETNFSKKWEIENLLKEYAGLTTGYKILEGRIEKSQKFAPITEEARSIFIWSVVISRIAIDFLRLGGQDYYSFCERCGKFTVVQRKGRKKFCSELCRVYAFNEKEEAEKAAKKSAR